MREIVVICEGLDRADGSARFAFGLTKCLASVSGPIEVRPQNELPTQAAFEVIVRPLSGVAGTRAKSIGTTLQFLLAPSIILTAHPRTLLQLVVQALNEDSPPTPSLCRMTFLPDTMSGLAAMINASTIALLNAGSIQMRGVVCAVAVGVDTSGSLLVDPAPSELPHLAACGCFAFIIRATSASTERHLQCEPVWTNWQTRTSSSAVHPNALARAREAAEKASLTVWEHLKSSMARSEPRSTKQAVIDQERLDESASESKSVDQDQGASSEDDDVEE
ncbi:hypothetical protein PUNSTDRAFT_102893 [Punctularia strigosozonata HHB-11173 SS5]|uniref:uncharacterized protein n=1 Tax=Punctularia strigosozonata (strain HHB-11173) TaxID=741275 RepID=UPI0004418440|nr:uncharacterized protein PUNSTDRAFT_102893 [Punctularia strigosozonata HHB-11173 SS5]EIN08128.1 hypothetical protein PUNSTDRAFT_102893 [Punctularia strigosozonata HHB-11173 SS5]